MAIGATRSDTVKNDEKRDRDWNVGKGANNLETQGQTEQEKNETDDYGDL